jgi:asparagine synthase (glutamine-hydrolysing)
MLSGGLDSSSVACAAHHTPRVNGEAVHTFSAVFDGVPKSDEKAYIKSVLDKYNFVSHFFRGDKLNPLSPFFSFLSNTIDEPLRAANIHINWEAFNKAQDYSVRVILDGFDGDTTVSHGIGALTQYAHEGRWGIFARELNAYTSNMGKSFWSTAWPYIRHFIVRPVLHRIPGYRSFRQSIISGNDENHDSPFGRDDLIDPNFASQMDWRDRRDSFETGRGGAFKAHREQHHHYLTSGKMPAALETIDRAAARFGVEVRFPFWDRQLVEFCLALPPQLKFGDGWTRRVHRLGMDGILPSEVQWRRDKSNVGMAFDQQLFRCNQKELERLVCGPTTRVSDFVNMDVVKQCYNKLRGGEVEGLESYHVWNAFTLDTWLSHIDGLRQSKN